MMGSISGYSRSCQMNSFARSLEYINCRRGLPVPEMMKGVLFSVANREISLIRQ